MHVYCARRDGVVVCCCGDNDNCTLSEKPALASHQRRRSCGGAQNTEKSPQRSRPISHPSTIEEACKLVEAGFEYVCDRSEAKIFRKRKEPLKNLLQCSRRILKWAGRDLNPPHRGDIPRKTPFFLLSV